MGFSMKKFVKNWGHFSTMAIVFGLLAIVFGYPNFNYVSAIAAVVIIVNLYMFGL